MCRTRGPGRFRTVPSARGRWDRYQGAPPPPRPEASGACRARLAEHTKPGGPSGRASEGGRGPGRRRRPRAPPSRAEPVRRGRTRGHRAPNRTWLQVMNSLVWVSSTSVHSLLRKAGTLELCFIVSQAQGFRIPLPNAEVAAAPAAAAAVPGNAHCAGAAAPGLRPLGALGRAVWRGDPAAARDGRGSGFHPCSLLPRRVSPRVQSEASGAPRSGAIGWCPRGGAGAGGVPPSLLPFRRDPGR